MQPSNENNRLATANAWNDDYYPGEYGGEPAGPSIFTLSTIRGLAFRQRYILIGITAFVLLAAFVATLLMEPVYQSAATVRVEPYGNNIVAGQDVDPGVATQEIDRYMQTQGSVIKSRKMAYRVADSLKLAKDDKFLGEVIKDGRPVGFSDEKWMAQRREIAAGMLMGGVNVDIPDENRIISISFRSTDPVYAAKIANAYADNYVVEDLRRNTETNAYARDYLRDQIEQVRARLQQSEMAANAYAKANGIVGQALVPTTATSQTSGASPTINATNLATINETYSTARTKRISAEQRWKAVANTPAAQLPEVQQSTTIQDLQSERAKAAAQLSELNQRYGDGFPKIQELKAQIGTLDAQIARTSADIKSSIRNDYEISLRQEAALSGELNKVTGDTLDEQDRRVRFNLLDREAGALRTQLASLLDRFNQVSSAANVNPGNISKLDEAKPSFAPVSPNLAKNLVLALVAGLGAALALAVLREVFDDRLRNTDDVERKLGLPLLGFTPDVSEDRIAEEASDPFSSLMEAYSSIRTSVDFALSSQHRVLQVTSSQPSEGKSLTSSVLARKYAQLGRKTLLVDSDLRKPSIATLFNAKRPSQGFVEVLLGDIDLKSALLPNTGENLDVLPVGSIPPNPVDLLSSQLLTDFVEKYRNEYAVIIFDSSPVMGLADAPLLSRHVDGTIFIVEANRSHYGQAKTALRRLRSAGGKQLGVVLTKYRSAEAGLAYDYHYQYYAYGVDRGRESKN